MHLEGLECRVVLRHRRCTGRHQVSGHLRGHTGRILMLAFTHDSEHLVDATLHCAAFDPATGRLLAGSAAGVTMMSIDAMPVGGVRSQS